MTQRSAPAWLGSVRHSSSRERCSASRRDIASSRPSGWRMPLAEERARERVDEPVDEDAVEPAARVRGRDEIRVAPQDRVEQRAEPPRIRRPRHRLEERARGGAERRAPRRAACGGPPRRRAAAGVDRRRGRARLGQRDRGPGRDRPLRVAGEHERDRGAARERGAQPRLDGERGLAAGGAIALGGDADDHVGAERLVRSRRLEHECNVGRAAPASPRRAGGARAR